MKIHAKIWKLGSIIALLLGCCFRATPTYSQGTTLLQPQDMIGKMRLTVLSATETRFNTPSVYDFCSPVDCSVPLMPKLQIGPFQVTDPHTLSDEYWKTDSVELYVDSHQIDLHAFGTVDFDYIFTNFKARAWNVVIDNPTLGLHTLRVVIHRSNQSSQNSTKPASDAIESVLQFTVQDTPCPAIATASESQGRQVKPINDSNNATLLGVQVEKAACGVHVLSAIKGTQAYKMELQANDTIRAVDGIRVINMYQLRLLLGNHQQGDKVNIIVDRAGEQIEVPVKLGEWLKSLPAPAP